VGFVVLAMAWVGGAVIAQAPGHGPAPSGYAGQETREIKALSAQQVEDLRAGRGMGLAMAAELNHYPGPKHVLELAEELELDAGTTARVQASYDRMSAEAKRLGAAIVEAEARLDALFREAQVTPESLRAATAEIAQLQGELRNAHLAAHLETRALLSIHQRHTYDRLRGYAGAHAGH
jgi:hypothetical protein